MIKNFLIFELNNFKDPKITEKTPYETEKYTKAKIASRECSFF